MIPAIRVTDMCCSRQLIDGCCGWNGSWHKHTVWSVARLLVTSTNETTCCVHALDSVLPSNHGVLVSDAKEVAHVCPQSTAATDVTYQWQYVSVPNATAACNES